LVSALLRSEELESGDTAWAMDEIMSGNATPVQIASFAVALRAKGETAGEISGLVEAMLGHATRLPIGDPTRRAAVDIVGTGGDLSHTVNISTMGALVVAGSGVTVVKHGNRAASSMCGAADLLEFLGVPLDLSPAQVAACVEQVGIGFCFAALFHAGYRHTAVARREMGVPTVFNFLGPLTNPGRPTSAAVGCADRRMASLLASVFAARGDAAIVMRGEDGLDEFTTTAPTRLWVTAGGAVRETVLDAADLGLARSTAGELRGADAAFNGAVARRMLGGETGAVRDAVVVNAAVALAARDGLDDPSRLATDDALVATLGAAITRGTQAIDSGRAAEVLDRWVTLATELKATV
jgi:anthranilate phosphoribosyltransferase